MFTKIRLRNFKSFDNIEFDLTNKNNTPKRLAIVFGENGAGKSNLMSAFVFLSEILETMDVRDAYEELLNQEAIFSDENMEKALRQRLMSGLRDIQAISNDYCMVGSTEPIVAEYEFNIAGNVGRYCIELGRGEIIHERLEYLLNRRRGIYFDCINKNLSINSGIVNDKDLLSDIKFTAKRFWGKHSILAIILHELRDKADAYGKDNISENFYDVLAEFSMLSSYVRIGSRQWDQIKAPIKVLEDAWRGEIPESEEYQLDVTEKVLTQFFAAINSDIRNVYYEKAYNDKYIEYQLFFKKLIAGTYRNIVFSKESTGNHQMLRVLCYILCACLGGITVIDEADSGIHDVLFQKVIKEISPLINGQLIMTTHNTMLMETDFARDSTYVINEEEQGHSKIRCISDYDKRTYLNNNIRNKYINNAYGGLPDVKPINFEPMLEQLSDNARKRHK